MYLVFQLNYTRPGLPKFNPKVLDNWKKEVKEKGFIFCVNNVGQVTSTLFLKEVCYAVEKNIPCQLIQYIRDLNPVQANNIIDKSLPVIIV